LSITQAGSRAKRDLALCVLGLLAGLIAVLFQHTPAASRVATAVSLYGVVDVTAGSSHSCALMENAIAVCWGDDTYGQASPPEQIGFNPRGPVTPKAGQISAGDSHTCAIAAGTGKAVCWGRNNHGQTSAPTDVAFTQLSAGANHTCGLTTSGRVKCWGSNVYGQSTDPFGEYTQVSAGARHTCAIRGDATGDYLSQTVDCWGAGPSGVDPPLLKLPLLPPLGPGEFEAPRKFLSISAGGFHNCGLQVSGLLFCWGDNTFNQSNPPTKVYDERTKNAVLLGAGPAVSCVGAPTYSLFVASDHPDGGWHVSCWGDDAPSLFKESNGFLQRLSLGNGHACVLAYSPGANVTDGAALCWGDDSFGQTRVPSPPHVTGGDTWLPTVTEGEPIVLDASAEFADPDQDAESLSYFWSFGPVGTEKTYDAATGTKATFPAKDGHSSWAIGIKAVDDDGLVAFRNGILEVMNAQPLISGVSASNPAGPDQPVTIAVEASDPAGADDPLTYEFDCDDDGAYEIGPQSAPSAQCSFHSLGSHLVSVLVRDDDGGSVTGQTEVTVSLSPTAARSPTSLSSPTAATSTETPPAPSASAEANEGDAETPASSSSTPTVVPSGRQASANLAGETPSAAANNADSSIDGEDENSTQSVRKTDDSNGSSSDPLPFLLGLLAGVAVLAGVAMVFREKLAALLGRDG
jgi:hypothetical protein